MKQLDIIDIKAAEFRLRNYILRTRIIRSDYLSELYNAEIWLKLENEQDVKSYKIRGSLNAMLLHLESGRKLKRVVCASAGNHAQGIAKGCRILGLKGDIFMPTSTPKIKTEAVREIGGKSVTIHLVGDIFDEALRAAHLFCETHEGTFIHPFDDEAVVCGQGTVGLEIIKELPHSPDLLLIPLGGGGLASGISTVFKSLSPKTEIVAVEPLGAPSMTEALRLGGPITIALDDRFVDGAAVARVGDLPFAICKTHLNRVVTVSENYIADVKDQLRKLSIIAEPAGALTVAALDLFKYKIEGKRVVCIISGGNDDPARQGDFERRIILHSGLENVWLITGNMDIETIRKTFKAHLVEITVMEYLDDALKLAFKVKKREDVSLLSCLLSLAGYLIRPLNGT